MSASPLKLSAISINDLMWVNENSDIVSESKLDNKQVQFFQSELTRLEREYFSSTEWSQMFLYSRENQFLFFLLRPRKGMTFAYLKQEYPEIVSEALHRSPETLGLAFSEWKAFKNSCFISRGRPVPDWPQYMEIEEAFALHELSSFEIILRRFKRTAQKWLKICGRVWWN